MRCHYVQLKWKIESSFEMIILIYSLVCSISHRTSTITLILLIWISNCEAHRSRYNDISPQTDSPASKKGSVPESGARQGLVDAV